ncbi:PspC domain-containing protein [Dietzia sp. UBA5065]|jgi:phage shock protein PspC (stress-responsive transcriptional regulator)|uniref:PspC domain-containing protein n=1 Tax=Dietzia sp. UBA5065 TaxID=1946422 RepID=UPI0025BE63F2|nr:PspC domain-containing protein [Dietzia sp. UBA5065]HMT51031.1 PspC domain-containing protein [Dietzia sp.]
MTNDPGIGTRRLERSSDRWIGGVCGGLAGYFGVDPVVVRILFVASLLLPGPQVLLYVIMWIVMPDARA